MKITVISITVVLFATLAFASTQEPAKTSVSFDGKFGGCAALFVYRTTEDKRKVVVVEANEKALNLTTTPQTFEIGTDSAVKVYIDDFGTSDYSGYLGYCTDIGMEGATKPTRRPAASGKVTIYISGSDESSNKSLHKVSVELKDVSFQASGDSFYYIEKAEMKDVQVGWLPG